MGVEDVARQLLEAMTSGDFEAEMALYAPDAVQHHPMADEPLEGRDAIRESERLLRDAFTDIDVRERSIGCWVSRPRASTSGPRTRSRAGTGTMRT